MGDARPELPEAHAHTVCFHESCFCVDATQTGYAIRKVTMQQAPMQLQQGFRMQWIRESHFPILSDTEAMSNEC